MNVSLSPVGLVGVQFGLYALGWLFSSLLLRQERRAALCWAAFMLLVGLGFVLAGQRDATRGWWAYSGSSLVFVSAYLALGHGLLALLREPAWRARGLWVVLALFAAAVVALGPGEGHAVARVLLTYSVGAVVMTVVVAMALQPMRRTFGSGLTLALALPGVLVVVALLSRAAAQWASPEQALELHRDASAAQAAVLAYLVGAAWFNFSFTALLFARLVASLREQSLQDPLTSLPNRRALQQALQREWARLHRGQIDAVTLLVLDLDHFKRVNDSHGHAAGDQVLCEAARRLRDTLRGGELLARTGGEEFVALLPAVDADAARAAAERLRVAVAGEAVVVRTGAGTGLPLALTVSIGLAQVRATGSTLPDPDALLQRADRALYAAKQAGRNRVESA
jgi:diguanylate cyclase (GGDEF)-like protein